MPTPIESGFVVRCVKISRTGHNKEVIKILSLDRNHQWRQKPVEQAFVHPKESLQDIWRHRMVNGRRPETVTPANYDGRDTVVTGQTENYSAWCRANLQPEFKT